MVETTLHAAIKEWYARPDDRLEAEVDGYIVDIVRGDLLIEIQTGNFFALKTKLRDLSRRHRIRLVHPISQMKWIVRLGDGETVISRRRSPKKGRVEDLFHELVYLPSMLMRPNLSLEAMLIHSEEVLIDDGRGSWRRRHWSIHNRRLLKVVSSRIFSAPSDFLSLLPEALPERFTTKDLTEALNLRSNLAQKMAYCLRHMGAIEAAGKRGRRLLYSRVNEGDIDDYA
jgi:hypothetical protein